MPNAVNITVGVVTTAAKKGLHELKHQFEEMREFANKDIGKLLVGAGLVETFSKIIEKGHEIGNLSQRFGVLPESLQATANAASLTGGSLEDTAQAYNKTAISQEKVRKGSTELRAALKDLNVDAKAFVQASPEEAFNLIADGVHNSADETKAYGAVIELMGRKAGAMFNTLKLGADGIHKLGSEMGVMSNESVEKIEELSKTLLTLKSNLMAGGAAVIGFLVKCVQSGGAIIGASIVSTMGLLKAAAKFQVALFSFNPDEVKKAAKTMVDEFTAAKYSAVKGAGDNFAEQMKDIWNPEEHEKKERPERDLEALESEKAAAEKLGEEYEKLADKKAKLEQDELKGEQKINDLMRERDGLNLNASFTDDLMEQAKMWDKALDVEKEIMTLREAADKEAEAQADRITKKRLAYENKILDMGLDGLPDDEKIAKLEERRQETIAHSRTEDNEEKRLDDLNEALTLEEKIAAIKKSSKRDVVADKLTKIGGGGIAFIAAKDPATERATKAAESSAKLLQTANGVLVQIKDKIGKAYWQP